MTVGVKADNGKIEANIMFEQFPKALKAVMEVATYGSKKYSRDNWNKVENAEQRYGDALVRHQIEKHIDPYDSETGYLHAAHMAWNALVCLQLEIERREQVDQGGEGEVTMDNAEAVFPDPVVLHQAQPSQFKYDHKLGLVIPR